jgi:isochorismate hydrolase
VQTRLTAAMPVRVLARLQRNISLLIKAANLQQIPIFASVQYPQGLGPLEHDIVKLLPTGTRTYEKTSFSCCAEPQFNEDLAASGRKQIIIAGMEAHICVTQTAMDLLADDYQVYIVVDAVCSQHRESYETSLTRLRVAGAIILDTESVLFEWIRDGKNKDFKKLQELMR